MEASIRSDAVKITGEQALVSDCPADFAPLERPYLLVTLIPCYQDDAGVLWLDQLWHHDLVKHLEYIKDFRLCAPRLRKEGQADLVRLEVPPEVRWQFVELLPQTSLYKALLTLPQTISALWRAIGEADIVHSGIVGWPYPLGWIANPFAILRHKHLIIVVESSWRRSNSGNKNWKSRIKDDIADFLARWSCARADVALFTHSAYRDALHVGARGTAYVTPAVWVNEADIIEESAADTLWARKLTEPMHLLFAGRLTESKGVGVLLSALQILDRQSLDLQVDIIGAGELRETCVEAARRFRMLRLSVLEPVPYGTEFFQIVRQNHAVLVPNLTDEQPRILFDANAQAVPVIASDTPGLRPHVDHDRTGWLVPTGNPEALANVIQRAQLDLSKLHRMGMASLAMVNRFSHGAMHRTRSHILRRHLAPMESHNRPKNSPCRSTVLS